MYPTHGPLSGGTVLALNVSHMVDTGRLHCSFNGIIVSAEYVTSEMVECTVPPVSRAMVSVVRVSLNGVDFDSSQVSFHHVSVPVVTHITPKAGPIQGGTELFLAGHSFVGTKELSCRFGGGTLVKAAFASSTLMKCLVPITNASGPVAIEVTMNGVDFIDTSLQFFYVDNIGANSLEPTSGPSSGGTKVIIRGSNFEYSDSLACQFGLHHDVPASRC
eukprot:Stramenopile-MAST_4_protein_3959